MAKEKRTFPNKSLVNERARHGWSQQEVADRVGTTPANVSRWERGVTTPNPYFRQRLVDLFEKSLEELGLNPQIASTSEGSDSDKADEPVDIQVDVTNNDAKQDTVLPLPIQEPDSVSLSIGEKELIPVYKPSSSHFHLWQASPKSFVARMVMLLSLILLFVLIGLFWFNSARPTPGAGSNPVTTTITGESVPALYNVKGQLALNDPLNSTQTEGGWHITDPNDPLGCHIIKGAYDLKELDNNYCLADNPSDAADFVYQIDMIIQQGSQAGIIFRATDNQHWYYDFEIGIDGSYRFYRSKPDALSTIMVNRYNQAIHTGYNHLNQLAVKAIGPDIFLYVNAHLIDHIHDVTYTDGNVGVGTVIADGGTVKGHGETDVTYTNAKVWIL